MAEDESDQESERLSEELEALAAPGPPAGLPALLHSQYYCRRFCQVSAAPPPRRSSPLPPAGGSGADGVRGPRRPPRGGGNGAVTERWRGAEHSGVERRCLPGRAAGLGHVWQEERRREGGGGGGGCPGAVSLRMDELDQHTSFPFYFYFFNYFTESSVSSRRATGRN